MSGVAKRSYGTGRLYIVVDRGGRASWYGSWWAGSTRVKRKVGLKRTTGNADGLTRTQAERELRRRVDAKAVEKAMPRSTSSAAPECPFVELANPARLGAATPVPAPVHTHAESRKDVSVSRWSGGLYAPSVPVPDTATGCGRRVNTRPVAPVEK
jgi:hypothetical protein